MRCRYFLRVVGCMYEWGYFDSILEQRKHVQALDLGWLAKSGVFFFKFFF
jgi:hypothetical protein